MTSRAEATSLSSSDSNSTSMRARAARSGPERDRPPRSDSDATQSAVVLSSSIRCARPVLKNHQILRPPTSASPQCRKIVSEERSAIRIRAPISDGVGKPAVYTTNSPRAPKEVGPPASSTYERNGYSFSIVVTIRTLDAITASTQASAHVSGRCATGEKSSSLYAPEPT